MLHTHPHDQIIIHILAHYGTHSYMEPVEVKTVIVEHKRDGQTIGFPTLREVVQALREARISNKNLVGLID